MAATQCRICYFISNGVMRFIVRPNADSQLNDAAYSPANCVCVNMPLATYDLQPTQLAVMQQSQPLVQAVNFVVGTLLATVISLLSG